LPHELDGGSSWPVSTGRASSLAARRLLEQRCASCLPSSVEAGREGESTVTRYGSRGKQASLFCEPQS